MPEELLYQTPFESASTIANQLATGMPKELSYWIGPIAEPDLILL